MALSLKRSIFRNLMGPVTVRDQNGNLVYEGLQKKGFPLRMHGLHSELVDIIRKEHRRAMRLV